MPIPGLRGTDHVGFTVPDIDQATDFFVNILGAELVYKLGPFKADDDWMSKQLNVHREPPFQTWLWSKF